MFGLGTLCQLYSMFSPEEPYMQQMSFMFVAMPSVLALINHYYYHGQDIKPAEEKNPSIALPNAPKNPVSHVTTVAATS